MRSKAFFFGLVLVLLNSCKTPAYLPSSDQIDVNPYGSYIAVNLKEDVADLKGELISIDNNTIIILTEENNAMEIPVAHVQRFKLLYARPKHYGGYIPVAVTLPFLNGFFSIFTMPLHLIVTTSVTIAGENAFTYNHKNMTFDKLKMLARFPQGIPPEVNTRELRYEKAPEVKK